MATTLKISTSKVDPWAVNNIQGLQGKAETMQMGLSDAQKNVMRARVGNQNQQAVDMGLQGLARNMGGTTSPLFAMNAARMRAGAGSATAAKMADVDVQNAQDQIATQQKQLGLQAEIGKLGLQARGQDIELQNSNDAAANALAIARLNAQKEMLLKYYEKGNPIADEGVYSRYQPAVTNNPLMDTISKMGL